ncbi:BON domain-containing protein [Pseudomaricurvus sp.]|uniref:BON domain-containing protein n=1 Tax=Pseudomaricurvus sp. TaxID=2004510 RepID=UPI003F6B8BBD
MKTVTKTLSVLALSVAAASASPLVLAGSSEHEGMSNQDSSYFSNGWKEGKIEGAVLFNENLSPFDIDVEVNDDVAHLVGTVSSEVDKDLAEQVALSVDGISTVDNQLKISKHASEGEKSERNNRDSEFVQSVKDATLTAQVKMKLLANDSVSGLDIEVNTEDHVVTLEGEVPTESVKDLAEKVVSNTENVNSVKNRLKVLDS